MNEDLKTTSKIADNLKKIEDSRYTFVTESGTSVLMQRMNKDMLWYAVYANQIIDWDQYRHDLEQRCNMLLS